MTRERRERRRVSVRAAFLAGDIAEALLAGMGFGIAAILLDSLLGTGSDALLYLYALLLALTAASGASILWITAKDMRSRGTSGMIRPIRGFDLLVGLAISIPSIYAISQIMPRLGS